MPCMILKRKPLARSPFFGQGRVPSFLWTDITVVRPPIHLAKLQSLWDTFVPSEEASRTGRGDLRLKVAEERKEGDDMTAATAADKMDSLPYPCEHRSGACTLRLRLLSLSLYPLKYLNLLPSSHPFLLQHLSLAYFWHR